MKKFLTTIQDIFKIEELRNKIFYTLGFLAVFRLGSYIVLPGVDPDKLIDVGGVFGMIDTLLGGAFNRASIFALGIMPYISASIVVQLLSVAMPYFQKMQKEGESGRKKLNQITRVLTIVITLAQGAGYLASTIPSDAIIVNNALFMPSAVIILTSGTMLCMWIGEKITEKGIGNGISMLIMIGIISRFPTAIVEEFQTRNSSGGLLIFVLEILALYFIVMGVIMLTQATRRIPIQYARQVVAGGKSKVSQGQRSYIPMKVNSANVMPIIFAQSLMFIPPLLASQFAESSTFAAYIGQRFSSFTSWEYNLTFAVLILLFTFFYTAITVNAKQMSDDMRRNNAFIPGVKPGDETVNYLNLVLDRITLLGALFLATVAILPTFANLAGVSINFAQFYGGTSLIIMVGVIIDTLQQIDSYLLMRHYDGMMKSGNISDEMKDVAVA